MRKSLYEEEEKEGNDGGIAIEQENHFVKSTLYYFSDDVIQP